MALLRPLSRIVPLHQESIFIARLAGLQICMNKTTKSLGPVPPKAPLTPFFQFRQENYEQLKVGNPGLPITDLARKLGEMYKALPKEKKETYVKKYMADKTRYESEKAKFLAGLTEEEKQDMQEELSSFKAEQRLRRKSRLQKQYGMPKKPAGSFGLFLQSKLPERENVPVTDFMKSVAAIWQRMPQEDKKVYVDQAAAERAQYQESIKAWTAKMKKAGHKDLIQDATVRKDLQKQILKLKRSYRKKENALKRDLTNLKKERDRELRAVQKKLDSLH